MSLLEREFDATQRQCEILASDWCDVNAEYVAAMDVADALRLEVAQLMAEYTAARARRAAASQALERG